MVNYFKKILIIGAFALVGSLNASASSGAGSMPTVALASHAITLPKTTPRGLLIFLDDGEKKLDVTSIGLSLALYQQAGPIITTASLLDIIFNHDETTEFRRNLNFEPAQWIIKSINESLYLLIPMTLLPSFGLEKPQVVATLTDPDAPITEAELASGFKLNHMKTVNIEDVKHPEVETTLCPFFAHALSLGKIFCTNADYHGQTVYATPSWALYALGHGGFKQSIIGISLNDFKETLSFLEHKVSCRLLFYSSCYAAGATHEHIFTEAHAPLEKTYPFAIITQAITDAAVSTHIVPVTVSSEEFAASAAYLSNFIDFLTAVTHAESIDYIQATSAICPLMRPRESNLRNKWSNIPQIKLPGLEWFNVLACKRNIVTLGKTLAMSRDPKSPLDLVRYAHPLSPETHALLAETKAKAICAEATYNDACTELSDAPCSDPYDSAVTESVAVAMDRKNFVALEKKNAAHDHLLALQTQLSDLQDQDALRAVLINAPDIPFELIINSNSLEIMISMIPGDATHTFRKISTTMSVTDLMSTFMKLDLLAAKKTFYIHELNELTNVLIDNCVATVDEHGHLLHSERYAYFTAPGGTCYKFTNETAGPCAIVPSNSPEQRGYLRRVAQLSGRTLNLGSFVFENATSFYSEKAQRFSLPTRGSSIQ